LGRADERPGSSLPVRKKLSTKRPSIPTMGVWGVLIVLWGAFFEGRGAHLKKEKVP